MKKRITNNTWCHDFEINQIVKVDRIDEDGDYWSNTTFFDADDCEDFDDYKPGDKIRIKQDTHLHKQKGNLVTITNLTEGYCADGSRSYMTEEGMFIPERDFDCYEGETYVNKQKETTTMKYNETTLITRPHDYTGCDPEIAEALKQGLDVYCEVWDDTYSKDENVRDWVTSYQKDDDWPYKNTETLFAYARPIRQEPVQETKPQTAIVIEHETAHLNPGDKVTIIRQHEDGDYLCEWRSGIRVWMQPEQIKFD